MYIFKRVHAGRGAVVASNNDAVSIKKAIVTLYKTFIEVNHINEQAIISIHFSITPDLTAANPATLLRCAGYVADIPLFCSIEPLIEGSMPAVIRILVYYYSRNKAQPVYVEGAEKLRPDLMRIF